MTAQHLEFLVGEPDGPEGPRGFFKFYRDLWDEKELGPKPVVSGLVKRIAPDVAVHSVTTAAELAAFDSGVLVP